jgi:hypothetical protein
LLNKDAVSGVKLFIKVGDESDGLIADYIFIKILGIVNNDVLFSFCFPAPVDLISNWSCYDVSIYKIMESFITGFVFPGFCIRPSVVFRVA